MTQATAAALNAVNDSQGTNRLPRVVKGIPDGVSAGVDLWYVIPGVGYTQVAKWISTAQADSTASQAAAILTGMTPQAGT